MSVDSSLHAGATDGADTGATELPERWPRRDRNRSFNRNMDEINRLQGRPIAVAVLLFLVYGTLSAALMLTNAYLVHGLELPWTWYWLLWTALFAPAVIATLLASIWTAPSVQRLRVLYGISLLIVFAFMETLWVMDAGLGAAIVVVAVLCVLICALFWTFQGAPERAE